MCMLIITEIHVASYTLLAQYFNIVKIVNCLLNCDIYVYRLLVTFLVFISFAHALCSEFLTGLEFFVKVDGKVVTQPINVNEVMAALAGSTTSSGEAFSLVVPTNDTGRLHVT